jgi:hypothetical protein
MTEHDASIEVSGRMAQNVANSVLDSLGVEPEEVEYISVDLTTANGSETDTHFDSGGPHAGVIAAQMLSAVDLDEATPESISVALDTAERDGDPEPDEEADEEAEEGNETVEISEPSDSGSDDDDSEYMRLTPDTNVHAALTAVAVYYTKVTSPSDGNPPTVPSVGTNGNRGVSAQELYRVVETDLSETELSSALRDAVSNNGVLSKDKAGNERQHSENLYWVNELGRAYLGEHGGHGGVTGDYSGVLDDEQEDTAHPYSALRAAMAGQTYDEGANKPGAGKVRDEPSRENPKDVGEDTRQHEVAWLLKYYHTHHGKDVYATSNDLAELDVDGVPKTDILTAALSTAYNKYHTVDRRPVGGSAPYNAQEYALSRRGAEAAEELGRPAAFE